MAGVRFDDVGKRFAEVEAVRDLSLEIADGEFMVLVGPSGSGKTTALRMLAGLEAISSGEIFIEERVVNDVSPKERDVAMVFQDYALYPQMNVFDNLAFGLRRRKLDKAEIQARVARAAEALELGELLRRRPGQLSGGQQQRVALGRALVRDPQVFLMDEPLSNLDAKLRVQTRGEIKRLQREIGTTTVYVTHDQVEAMTMGDRIAVMNQGRLEQVGTPDELYERPSNLFVAGFIGSPAMSFARVVAERSGSAGERLRGEGLDLRVGGDGLDLRLRGDGLDLRVGGDGLDLPALAGGELPDEAILGVRPEHARPWRAESGMLGPLSGSVAYVEALGRETFLGVDLAPDTRIVVCVEGRAREQVGDVVEFGIAPEGIRMFAAGDGRALSNEPAPRAGASPR